MHLLPQFLSINAWNMKIGFSFAPIAMVAMLFGPIPATVVAALGNFLGALLFEQHPICYSAYHTV